MEYRVTWIIDLGAESFEDAARLARKTGTVPSESSSAWTVPSFPDPDSLATHFLVRDRHGDDREVWADSKHPW